MIRPSWSYFAIYLAVWTPLAITAHVLRPVERASVVAAETTQAPQQRLVRGLLFRGDKCCDHRAPGLAVRVTHPKYGPSSFVYSGSDGMYYLTNIPAGDYTLEVWLTNDPKNVLRVTIKVGTGQLTDIPPVRVP